MRAKVRQSSSSGRAISVWTPRARRTIRSSSALSACAIRSRCSETLLRRAKDGAMNGAESLVRTLVACGVDTCFANPGTSEMHFVAALDRIGGLRCVLALFEGGGTGGADGY